MFVCLFTAQQLDSNPQQQKPACCHQEGNLHDLRDHQREKNAQHHGGERAQDNAPAPLMARQIAARQGDNDSIVARQQQINPDDLPNGNQ